MTTLIECVLFAANFEMYSSEVHNFSESTSHTCFLKSFPSMTLVLFSCYCNNWCYNGRECPALQRRVLNVQCHQCKPLSVAGTGLRLYVKREFICNCCSRIQRPFFLCLPSLVGSFDLHHWNTTAPTGGKVPTMAVAESQFTHQFTATPSRPL